MICKPSCAFCFPLFIIWARKSELFMILSQQMQSYNFSAWKKFTVHCWRQRVKINMALIYLAFFTIEFASGIVWSQFLWKRSIDSFAEHKIAISCLERRILCRCNFIGITICFGMARCRPNHLWFCLASLQCCLTNLWCCLSGLLFCSTTGFQCRPSSLLCCPISNQRVKLDCRF